MSYDIVNPILVEARPSQQGGLELCIPLPLLTRLKEKLQASFFLCLNCVVTTNDFFPSRTLVFRCGMFSSGLRPSWNPLWSSFVIRL